MEKRPLPPGFRSAAIVAVDLPAPMEYRALHPAILGPPPESAKARFFRRKRVIVGFTVAAVFHISLGLAWWLSPPLRLKAGYAPDRWVQVQSIPAQTPVSPSEAAPVPVPLKRNRPRSTSPSLSHDRS